MNAFHARLFCWCTANVSRELQGTSVIFMGETFECTKEVYNNLGNNKTASLWPISFMRPYKKGQ